MRGGLQGHGNHQCGGKREEKIEGNGLGDDTASRKEAREHPGHPPKNPRRRNHSRALYCLSQFVSETAEPHWSKAALTRISAEGSGLKPVFPCGSRVAILRLRVESR